RASPERFDVARSKLSPSAIKLRNSLIRLSLVDSSVSAASSAMREASSPRREASSPIVPVFMLVAIVVVSVLGWNRVQLHEARRASDARLEGQMASTAR